MKEKIFSLERKKKKKNFWFFLLTFILFVFFVSLVSHPVGKSLSAYFFPPSPKPSLVAEIGRKKGEILIRSQGQTYFSLLSETQKNVFHLDRIQTGKDSFLTLLFPSGYEMKILPQSEVVLELWNSNSVPAYLHFSYGDYSLMSQGKKGELFITQKGKTFIPSQNSHRKPKSLESHFSVMKHSSISSHQPKNLDSTLSHDVKNAKEEDSPPTSHPTSHPQIDSSGFTRKSLSLPSTGSKNTLTNSYIQRKISKANLRFKNCRKKVEKKDGLFEGKVFFGFEINPTGEVEKFKIIKSDFKKNSLENCVSSVMRRMHFKPFKGKPIYYTFALNFE